MLLATKTMARIDAAMTEDQGSCYRILLGRLMPLAGDAYSPKHDDWRDHLGASIIGRECSREVWYSFRWSTLKRFDGRMLRLFNRGHLEEPRLIAALQAIGCEVWQTDANGKQFRITGYKGHFGGSMDAVVRGCPDMPDEAILAEFKTHGEKSYLKLVEEGVMRAKWEHFVQMQLYMGKNNLNWALYMATNKNTDAIHAEMIQFDPREYQRYQDRAEMVIDAKEPPPRIGNSPGHFKCKFCDHTKLCYNLGAVPEMNCRTCEYSQIEDDGKWRCVADHNGLMLLTPEMQRKGCKQYLVKPSFKNKV
jgi:hypothetical protein